jgi:hypothetical protein
MECPACLCLLASKDPSRLEGGKIIRDLISQNVDNIKEEFFKKSRSFVAAHAFWNSFEALTARYVKTEIDQHKVKDEGRIKSLDGPVIFAAHL